MNLVKKKGKKRQKEATITPAAQEMESFDDFLNTLSDDDDESQQSADSDDENAGRATDSDEDRDEDEAVEEEEELDVDEDEEHSDEESAVEGEGDNNDEDDDNESLDLNAELEKSLENEKALVQAGPVTEEGSEDEDVDYFLRDEEPDDESTQEETASSLKKSLGALQETDPEFFAYLKENDAELLNFEASDEEGDDSDEEDDEEAEGGAHVPPAELEVASDSEAESEEEQVADKNSAEHRAKVASFLKRRIVNLSVISHWEQQLTTTRDLSIFAQVVDAFESAVETVLQDKEVGGGGATAGTWKVEGSSNFNALIRLCIRHIFSFCTRYLCATNNAVFAAKSFTKAPLEVRKKNDGRWAKLRKGLRTYMNALMQFLRSMGNPEAITSVLRHCQTMAGFWALFTSKAQKLLRTLIGIWSAGEDSARIAAFVTILRMANYNQEFFLARVLKQMYIAFVSNCKFTTPNSWPAINFMRASLVEIYLLDTGLAYTIAFPFVRQLAIHLRNATMAGSESNSKATNSGEDGAGKGMQRNRTRARARGVTTDGVLGSKKEATRIVVSWQFLHSIHLWAHLLGEASVKGDESLKLLVHPVVQIAVGTVRLVPTRKFIPLRFHIVRILTELQAKTGVFIPILPLALQVLKLTDFSYKSTAKFSVRPLNLQCCLKADAAETGYHKALADAIYDTVLGVCHVLGSDIAFPELMTQPVQVIKTFLRNKCKNSEVSRRFKTLVEKVEANATFVGEKRSAAMDAGLVHLGDEKSIQVLRIEIENAQPSAPIVAFAQEWKQMHARQMAKLQRAAMAAAGVGKGGKRGQGSGDETREERLIPKLSDRASKRSQGAKKRAQMEKVLFADEENGEFNGEDSSDEEYRTKFNEELEMTSVPSSTEAKSKKDKKKTKDRATNEDDNDDNADTDDEPKKKKSKKVKTKGGKKNKKGKSKVKATWEEDDAAAGDDLHDEIVDFDDFEDSD